MILLPTLLPHCRKRECGKTLFSSSQQVCTQNPFRFPHMSNFQHTAGAISFDPVLRIIWVNCFWLQTMEGGGVLTTAQAIFPWGTPKVPTSMVAFKEWLLSPVLCCQCLESSTLDWSMYQTGCRHVWVWQVEMCLTWFWMELMFGNPSGTCNQTICFQSGTDSLAKARSRESATRTWIQQCNTRTWNKFWEKNQKECVLKLQRKHSESEGWSSSSHQSQDRWPRQQHVSRYLWCQSSSFAYNSDLENHDWISRRSVGFFMQANSEPET